MKSLFLSLVVALSFANANASEPTVVDLKDQPEASAIPAAESEMPVTPKKKMSELKKKIIRNFMKLDGDLTAIHQALCFHDRYKNTKFPAYGDSGKSEIDFRSSPYMMIFDMTKSSRLPRFFVINLQTGEVEATVVAHGRGRGMQETENIEFARSMSNENGSYLSSNGFFITGQKYRLNNPAWKIGMHLYGLEKGINDQVFRREVIIHGDPGMRGPLISSTGREDFTAMPVSEVQPLSWGCMMLPPMVAQTVMERTKMEAGSSSGSLVYAFSQEEKDYGPLFCGGD